MQGSCDKTRVWRIAILMIPGQVPLDLIGPWQVLRSAASEVSFQIDYIGPQPQLDWLGPLALSGISPLPDDLHQVDLLLVPGQYRAAIEPDAQRRTVD
ncbi:hypothetical protein [Halomonas litopenaei]|uniref:hypothetical protein n=1 Tax=Halomonas litopenaei TaxID=2109328 RepID=UPI003F9FA3A0